MTDRGPYVELSGDELRRWMDAPPVAVCGRCGRNTWETGQVGAVDWMTQPDGYPCGGWFVDSKAS